MAVSYTHLDVYKRQLLYTGPYIVSMDKNNNTYEIKEMGSGKIKGVYNRLP